MSRGSYPLLLTMALSAPGAAHALGLGDIHIDSHLNQPLSAQIDIIGASEQDLSALRVAVANRDVFQQMGADRPSLLSTAQFKVSHDAHGRPVLSVRSSEAFTDPVVSLVIELHWPTGALVREYTLLLDPAGLGGPSDSALDSRWSQAPVTQNASDAVATASAQAPSPLTPPATKPQPDTARHSVTRAHTAPPATDDSTSPSSYTVRDNDTLQGIARKAGARSAADVRRMMIAMFRANSDAFDDNINRLRSGSVLLIPDAAALASLTSYEVNRDYRAQMSAWRLAGRPAASPQDPVIPAPTPAAAAPVAAAVAGAVPDPESSPSPAPSESAAELEQRVQALQASLADMDRQIAQRDAQLFKLRQQAATAAATPATAAPEIAIHYEVQPARDSTATSVKRTVAAASTLGSIAALIALIRMRRRKPGETPAPAPIASAAAEPEAACNAQPAAPAIGAPAHMTAARPTPAPAARSTAAAAVTVPAKPHSTDEETIILDTTGDATPNFEMDPTVALSHEEIMADLENTAHHVNMPSDLNSPAQAAPFVERRKSVIDVLRVAIEREPHRRELKMKLLEIYYAAAASNQASFLEIAKALARDRDVLATGDWERIAAMGRTITPNERLFLPVGQTVADADREEENVA